MSRIGKQTAFKALTVQSIAYTGTAGVIANAITEGIRRIRITTTTTAFIAFGDAPTATTSSHYLPADTPWEVHIDRTDKVSAIQETSGGTLYVTELDQ